MIAGHALTGDDALIRALLLSVGILLAASMPARAGTVLTRIQHEGVLHCGAVERPGIAEAPPSGGAVGVAVDICRALAIAVLGPSARVTFRLYDSPYSFDAMRQGEDEVAFLTGGEIADQNLGEAVLPGPAIVINVIAAMVPVASPVRHVAELSGQTVCMMIGSTAQRALEAAADAGNLSLSRLAFEEDVEMLDAYNAGRCGAVVAEAGRLGAIRLTPGVRKLESRLLPEPLAAEPIIAVTGLGATGSGSARSGSTGSGDAAWSAAVAWVLDALLLADAPANAWGAAGAAALPVRQLSGLHPGWTKEVVAGLGGYAAIIRRNLTDRLGLAPGPNALWPQGILVTPAMQ